MKRGILNALAVAALSLLVCLAVPATPEAEPAGQFTAVSAAGLYRISMEPEVAQLRQGELHSWLVAVQDVDGDPVMDAQITVDGGMPEHDHGLPTAPEVTENLGDGRYRIEGVKFSMRGRWELRLAIISPAGSDTVIFELTI